MLFVVKVKEKFCFFNVRKLLYHWILELWPKHINFCRGQPMHSLFTKWCWQILIFVFIYFFLLLPSNKSYHRQILQTVEFWNWSNIKKCNIFLAMIWRLFLRLWDIVIGILICTWFLHIMYETIHIFIKKVTKACDALKKKIAGFSPKHGYMMWIN